MLQVFASFVCGFIFGLGLLVSGLTNPMKVLGFLDVLGRWDPTLVFAMAGAVVVTAVGYAAARRSGAPLLARYNRWPAHKGVDFDLLAGSALFGAGWGLAGVCPGPALVNLTTLSPRLGVFIAALVVGILMQDAWRGLGHTVISAEALAKAEAEAEAAMADG